MEVSWLDIGFCLHHALGRMTKEALRTFDEAGLLDTAARLFRQKGFAATTLREIAQAAGVLPGSIHYRYPAKEALLVALMDRAIERAIAAVRTAAAQSSDPTERVRLGLRAHLQCSPRVQFELCTVFSRDGAPRCNVV